MSIRKLIRKSRNLKNSTIKSINKKPPILQFQNFEQKQSIHHYPHTWTRPVWSRRLTKVRPPWILCKATHPQSLTFLPTSSVDKSPQYLVLLTQTRLSFRGCACLGSESRESAAGDEAAEAEVEQSRADENGLVLSFWKKKQNERVATDSGLERRDIRGTDLSSKDMDAFVASSRRAVMLR